MMASSCRMAGSEINALLTSGTQAEDARHEKKARIAATNTKGESCERYRRHHILWCCPNRKAADAKGMGAVRSR